MDTALRLLRRTRQAFLGTTKDLSDDQLLHIPEGFNNNILWNLGHVAVTQQLLTYNLSGLSLNVGEEMLKNFRNGTSPGDWQTPPDVEEIRALCLSLVDKTVEDYEQGLFEDNQDSKFPYTTRLGGELENLEDAVQFNNLHEGLHFGTVRSMERLLGQGLR